MVRRMIEIDEERCNGCGICAQACHEGAIGMINGKAQLLRDEYCDGLGDCLPACPTGAISFIEREAAAYNAQAVKAARQARATTCIGASAHSLARQAQSHDAPAEACPSQLRQWPVQIQLAPVQAPYFDDAQLLIAADCTAYARADFHARFMKDHITLIGCPKLDASDYAEKLAQIIARNRLRGISVARMQVPCCGGVEQAVRRALEQSGSPLSCQVIVIATDGSIVS